MRAGRARVCAARLTPVLVLLLCLAPCIRLAMFVKEGDTGPKLLPAAAKKLQASGKKSTLDTSKFQKCDGPKVQDSRKQGEFGAKKFIKP
jgi:hypothetical protein